ncbi:MAG: peptidyl-prolyl cis-trans isomerase [Bacteroides sp.]|nr:peptidyl-prolyl cis-trans isomerase [Bacteroides sp.]
MRNVFLFFITVLFFVSCGGKRDHRGQWPLVEVEGNILYKEDLLAVLPAGLSADDSLLFAENYIRNWVEDVLLYEQARRNIPDSEEVEKLVENYRKSLIMHTYQQELIHQRLSRELTSREMEEYYENNKGLFTLESPIVKGLFIKVPLKAPGLNNVRRWYRDEDLEAVENLEKYSLQHAVKYEYFYDKWVALSDVFDLIPVDVGSPEEYVRKNRQIELKDTAFYYFLHVTDLRVQGEQEPYEFAEYRVREMLLNLNRVEFMRTVTDELYQRALRGNKIKYNY